jgi:hypothetical protein
MVGQPSAAEGRWIPPGRSATVGAHGIPGGLIYIGRHLRAYTGGVEPALINPDLPVTAAGVPTRRPDPGSAPAYHLLPASSRAAYLAWLAGGRTTEIADGLVLLFCFGLERRVLVDADHDPAARLELPAITAEVRRLRARYGDGGAALRVALDRLLELLELLTAPRLAPAGAPDGGAARGGPQADRGPAASSMAVRVALARFAAAAAPVPADWARVWARDHPALTRRSAQVHCPEEFDRLFARRYHDRHGSGLVPPDDVPGIRLRYRPSSPGLTATLVCREDLPDVLAEPRSARALGALADEVAAALDPYRRWLARFPQGRGSLAATTLLPLELVDAGRGELGALRVWAETRLDGRPWTVVDAAGFAAFWSTATPDRMARDEAAALLAVLALVGVGVEPDVRFGAPALAAGPALLFRLNRAAADRPGTRFRAAAAVARCAAAVASAAGPVDPRSPAGAAVLATVRDLAALFRVDPDEDVRLTARLAWLLTTGVDVDRLGRQTALLDRADRDIAGHYLIAMAAAADPAVPPATVAMLTRVYRILGLEPNLVFQRLHEHSLGGPPASVRPTASAGSTGPLDRAGPERSNERDGPVVVRPAEAVPSGYALPWAATPAQPAVPPGGLPLDPAAIMRKLAESAVTATLLSSIFDTDGPPEPDRPAPPVGGTGCVAGFDLRHSLVLRALAARPSWTRAEFASLAAEHGVLPEGAFDLLNEVAIDAVGAPVLEDDVTLVVNNDVLLELLA